MDSLRGFECYDHLLVEPFKRRGWKVQTVSWRNKTADWNFFDAVIIRSCWDYQEDSFRFLDVLYKIDQSSALLANSLDLVEWNINKSYLKVLDEQGVTVVPTLWQDNFNPDDLPAYFSEFDTNEIIIKPTISANADNTFYLKKPLADSSVMKLHKVFNNKPFLVQPFMQNIVGEGEYSLFYFNGNFSHAILKTPNPGDFRVQEEHGGRLKSVKPSTELLKSGDVTMKALPKQPLYARVDFASGNSSYFLMEVELIEPSLYFNMDSGSPERFTGAFIQMWKAKTKKL